MKTRRNILKGIASMLLGSCVAVSLFANTGVVASAEATTYYSQDFTGVTETDASNSASAFYSMSQSSTMTIASDDTHGNYLSFANTGTGGYRGARMNFVDAEGVAIDVSETTAYIVEFDAALTPGNAAESAFAVKGTDYSPNDKSMNNAPGSGYLIKLVSGGKNSVEYTLNDGEKYTIPSGEWCHYTVYVDKGLELVSTTIIGSTTGTIVEDAITGYNGAGDVAGIHMRIGRSYYGAGYIDNVVVRSVTENDVFGKVEAETLSSAEFTAKLDTTISQPAAGEVVYKEITVKGNGSQGGDLTDEVEVKWSLVDLDGGDSNFTLVKAEGSDEAPEGATAYLKVENGAALGFGYVQAVVSYGEDSYPLKTVFTVIDDSSIDANQLAPAAGYPVNMNDYLDGLVGYQGTANGADSKDVVLNNWSIYGSNGARTMKLVQDADGTKAIEFASNNGGGSTLAVYQWPNQTETYVIDFVARFSSSMTFGVYDRTANDTKANAEWAATYSANDSALTMSGSTESISGIAANTWYRFVVTANPGTQKVKVEVYDKAGNSVGTIKNVALNDVSTKYLCFQGTFPMYINSFEAYKPDAEIIGYNVNLSELIELNYYMNFSDEVASTEGAKMVFTLDNGEVVAESAIKDCLVGDTYVFPCLLEAKEMSDTITATLVVGNTETVIDEYSVQEYAATLLTDSNAKDDALVKAMLNYGAYAQTYFNYNPSDLANAGYADTTLAMTGANLSAFVPNVDATPSKEGYTYAGSTISLDDGVLIRHYFELADGVTPSGAYMHMSEDGTYCYYESSAKGVSAWGTADTDYDSAITGCAISNYSPMSYVTTVLDNKDGAFNAETNYVNVLKAMYLYYAAAQAYAAN